MIRTKILKVTTNQGLVKGQKRPEIKLQRHTRFKKGGNQRENFGDSVTNRELVSKQETVETARKSLTRD